MIDSRRLAGRVRNSIVKEIAEQQQLLVMIRLLREEHGDRAVPPHPIYQKSVLGAAKDMTLLEQGTRERLDSNYAILAELEPLLKDADDENMARFAEFFASRGMKTHG